MSSSESLLHFPFWFWQLIIFPILISFIIFYINKLSNRLSEYKRIAKLDKFIMFWLEETLKALDYQVEEIKFRISIANGTNEESYYETGEIEFDMDRILKIKNEDLYTIFIDKRQNVTDELRKDFYSLLISLKSVKRLSENYKNGYDNFSAVAISLSKQVDAVEKKLWSAEDGIEERIRLMKSFNASQLDPELKRESELKISKIEEILKKYKSFSYGDSKRSKRFRFEDDATGELELAEIKLDYCMTLELDEQRIFNELIDENEKMRKLIYDLFYECEKFVETNNKILIEGEELKTKIAKSIVLFKKNPLVDKVDFIRSRQK